VVGESHWVVGPLKGLGMREPRHGEKRSELVWLLPADQEDYLWRAKRVVEYEAAGWRRVHVHVSGSMEGLVHGHSGWSDCGLGEVSEGEI